MATSAKYTTNFVDPSKPGMYSGAELPPTDVSDAGKQVAVDESGAYSLIENTPTPTPGSGGVFWITFTQDNTTVLADKTISEILSAIASNMCVQGRYPDDNSVYNVYTLTMYRADSVYNVNEVAFTCTKVDSRPEITARHIFGSNSAPEFVDEWRIRQK